MPSPGRGQKAVGQADFVDGEPGVALQVQRLSQIDRRCSLGRPHPSIARPVFASGAPDLMYAGMTSSSASSNSLDS